MVKDPATGSSTDAVLRKTPAHPDNREDEVTKHLSRPLGNDDVSASKLNGHLESDFPGRFTISDAPSTNVDEFSDEQLSTTRMFASQFLQRGYIRAALASEINGLTAPDTDGIPPLKLALRDDRDAQAIAAILSTMVVRRQSTMKVKARLCIRRDTLVRLDHTCSTAPYRSAVRSISTLASSVGMKIAPFDVSQSFIQSPRAAAGDRLLIRAPWYIAIPRVGKIRTPKPPVAVREEYYFATQRPLYGLKDIPARWYFRICQTLRSGPYRQRRTDFCHFRAS